MARRQPEQQAAPVQRLRVRYAKRGRARFTSHRDFGRAFERALRRAGIPMAYSSGFSPHPRISYANASPTGAASEAEYLEIGLAEARTPAAVQAALDAALPPGLDVLEVVESSWGALADALTGSRWRVALVGVPAADLAYAVRAFLGAAAVPVSRMTKNGLREFDARAAVVTLTEVEGGLEMLLEHGTPLVRPDDVLTGLTRVSPAFVPAEIPVLTRMEQGRLNRASATLVAPSS
ncbi:MAG TPA: TIGR03936 family radical SAM-associated protein [Propionibacteriaceae bacterium]|nr:TIGR03936 family radical SAM-associated protein [Propionibacteriaceae bacterium]